MKKYISLFLFLPLIASAQNATSDFDRRLKNIFEQKTRGTLGRQMIFSTVEASLAVSANALLSPRDKKVLAELKDAIYMNEMRTINPEKKEAVRKQLNTRLVELEGQLVKRASAKTLKFLVRGTQIFLVIDIGTRLYILEAMGDRDPGVFPTKTIFCANIDCPQQVDDFLNISNEYFEAIPKERNY